MTVCDIVKLVHLTGGKRYFYPVKAGVLSVDIDGGGKIGGGKRKPVVRGELLYQGIPNKGFGEIVAAVSENQTVISVQNGAVGLPAEFRKQREMEIPPGIVLLAGKKLERLLQFCPGGIAEYTKAAVLGSEQCPLFIEDLKRDGALRLPAAYIIVCGILGGGFFQLRVFGEKVVPQFSLGKNAVLIAEQTVRIPGYADHISVVSLMNKIAEKIAVTVNF